MRPCGYLFKFLRRIGCFQGRFVHVHAGRQCEQIALNSCCEEPLRNRLRPHAPPNAELVKGGQVILREHRPARTCN